MRTGPVGVEYAASERPGGEVLWGYGADDDVGLSLVNAEIPTQQSSSSSEQFSPRESFLLIAIVITFVAGFVAFLSRGGPTARENGWLFLSVASLVLLFNRLRSPKGPRINPGTLLAVGGVCFVVISATADQLNLGSRHGIGLLQVAGAAAGAAAVAGGLALRTKVVAPEAALNGRIMWLLPRVLAVAIAITVISIAATKLPVEPNCPRTVPELADSVRGLSTSLFDERNKSLFCVYDTGGGEL